MPQILLGPWPLSLLQPRRLGRSCEPIEAYNAKIQDHHGSGCSWFLTVAKAATRQTLSSLKVASEARRWPNTLSF